MGLIAHYLYGEDGKDKIGVGVGQLTDIGFVEGKNGLAGDFNGTTSRLLIQNAPYLNLKESGSISSWIFLRSVDAWKRLFMRGPHDNYQLDISPSRQLRSELYTTSGLKRLYSTTTLPLDQWVHCCTTFGEGWQRIYINGQLDGESTFNDVLAHRPNDVTTIGGDSRDASTSGNMDALIQDVRVYDHPLTKLEIRGIFTSPTVQLLPLTLDNTSDTGNYLVIKDSPTITGDTTIMFWLYPTSLIRQTIWDKGYAGEGVVNFEATSQKLRFYSGPSGDSGADYQQVDSPPVPLNEWTHATVTRNMATGEVKWYLNAVLVSVGTFTIDSIGRSFNDLIVGSGYTNDFIGKLRSVKQFASVLSQSLITEFYEQALSMSRQGDLHINSIIEGIPYLSPLNSSQVNFGGNGYNNTSGESDPCSGLLTFDQALQYTYDRGGRLPTKDEMENDATAGTGCGYDSQLCWTCDEGVDEGEHWVVVGNSAYSTPPEIRKNTETAYVRFVVDDDLERQDPVLVTSGAIKEWFLK